MKNLFCRFFFSILIVLILVPQTPEWNPVITQLRAKNLFLTYESAKKNLAKITWGAILIFYYVHYL
uniref:Uncharacterized protein n=1 Tax=Flabellia petiolata TaxID=189428 RepID=A0A386AX93_9CHLO|nr:hypothetical protein Ycf47 [Flabellia petiolata]